MQSYPREEENKTASLAKGPASVQVQWPGKRKGVLRLGQWDKEGSIRGWSMVWDSGKNVGPGAREPGFKSNSDLLLVDFKQVM